MSYFLSNIRPLLKKRPRHLSEWKKKNMPFLQNYKKDRKSSKPQIQNLKKELSLSLSFKQIKDKRKRMKKKKKKRGFRLAGRNFYSLNIRKFVLYQRQYAHFVKKYFLYVTCFCTAS